MPNARSDRRHKKRRRAPAAAAPETQAGPLSSPDAARRRRWFVAATLAVIAVLMAGYFSLRPEHSVVAVGPIPVADFVGGEACVACHAAQTTAWQRSQHARAMQRASPQTVQGQFDDARFPYAGVQSAFSRRDERFVVRTDGPDGKLADFDVKYTFGVEPLQQYLVELPGGRLQALSIAWDTRPQAAGGERWFHLYPNDRIDHRDGLHWTGRQQNWNFMCADCHSVNVRKQYDATNGTYATTWSDLSVGCEGCHGPGSAHIAWAKDKRPSDARMGLTVALDQRHGAKWTIDPASGSAKRDPPCVGDREIDVCAQCHARRAQIAEGYVAGRPFLDHYLPALLTSPLFYANGQQQAEDYVWASFLQSRMYRHGVTCSDCHDAHTGKTRVADNGLCAQCHASAKYAATSHHHHDPASEAGRCVNCHMPTTTYMVVDARRDHSLRIPRPDQTVAFGVPNACNDCHREKDAQWSAQAMQRWYGQPAAGFQTFAPAFAAAEEGEPGAAAALAQVADDIGQSPIARASALERLAPLQYASLADAARRGAQDAHPLVRLAAVQAAEALPVPERAAVAVPLLGDPLRAVRIEAARVLAPAVPGSASLVRDPAWTRAAAEFVATQNYNADRPEARVALGSFDAALGRYDEAQAAFAAARKLDSTFAPSYVNAADAFRAAGKEAAARDTLKDGIAMMPDSAVLHHSLGLSYARQQQSADALRELERAVALAPDQSQYVYVYAVGLNSFGRTQDAIRTLERAAQRWPRQRDVQLALATMYRDAGRRDAARNVAKRYADAFPDDTEVQALVRSLN